MLLFPDARLVVIGFIGALGLTFLFLGCVLTGSWWTLLMFIFYGFTPLPLLFVNNDGYQSFDSVSNKSMDIAIFFCTGMVVSTIAFPLVLATSPIDHPTITSQNAFFAEAATVLLYMTAGLFLAITVEEDSF